MVGEYEGYYSILEAGILVGDRSICPYQVRIMSMIYTGMREILPSNCR